MSYPYPVSVSVDFSTTPLFGVGFSLDDAVHGLLDVSSLGDSAAVVVDVSSTTNSANIKGGYNLLTDQFEATICQLRIYDPNGDWNPQNTSSPYYGKLIPNRKIRISAQWGGLPIYLFSGYANSYTYSYPKDQLVGFVSIVCADAFRLFQLSNVTTIAGAVAGQSTGARINAILDAISWPASMRVIDTGDTLCQADPGTLRTALSALKIIEATEQGAFYIDGSGNAVFKSRSKIQVADGAAPITYFNNNGTAIGYADVTFAHDDKLIINQTTVTNVGGTAQTSADAASITKYFPHSINFNNLLSQTDADALRIAQLYTATRKETSIRIDNIKLDLTTPGYSAGITAALTLDYFNTVSITSNTQGATAITKVLQIMGNEYDITPTTFAATFTTSAVIASALILDSPLYGVLDTSVITY